MSKYDREHYELERFKAFTAKTSHEDDLINQRTSWFVTLQSFLFISLALIAGNLEGWAVYAFAVIYAFIGISVSLTTLTGVRAAQDAIDAIGQKWVDREEPLKNMALPPLKGAERNKLPPMEKELAASTSLGRLIVILKLAGSEFSRGFKKYNPIENPPPTTKEQEKIQSEAEVGKEAGDDPVPLNLHIDGSITRRGSASSLMLPYVMIFAWLAIAFVLILSGGENKEVENDGSSLNTASQHLEGD